MLDCCHSHFHFAVRRKSLFPHRFSRRIFGGVSTPIMVLQCSAWFQQCQLRHVARLPALTHLYNEDREKKKVYIRAVESDFEKSNKSQMPNFRFSDFIRFFNR